MAKRNSWKIINHKNKLKLKNKAAFNALLEHLNYFIDKLI